MAQIAYCAAATCKNESPTELYINDVGVALRDCSLVLLTGQMLIGGCRPSVFGSMVP